MQLAVVRGQCTATIKDASYGGRRLVLVQCVDETGEPTAPVEVALDVTAAAAGQTVLVARGSAARVVADIRQAAADLAVVAIVDHLSVDQYTGAPAAAPATESAAQTRTTRKAQPRKQAAARTTRKAAKKSPATPPRNRRNTGGK